MVVELEQLPTSTMISFIGFSNSSTFVLSKVNLCRGDRGALQVPDLLSSASVCNTTVLSDRIPTSHTPILYSIDLIQFIGVFDDFIFVHRHEVYGTRSDMHGSRAQGRAGYGWKSSGRKLRGRLAR